MNRGTYIRRLKKERKKWVNLLRINGYFLACDDNVYKVDQDKLWHPNFVDGNPHRYYECVGISLDGKDYHECDIDHCLVCVFDQKEAIDYDKEKNKIYEGSK